MRNPDSGRFAEKREAARSVIVGFDAADSHLVKICMGSGIRIFGGRAIYLENDKKVYESTATTESIWLSRFMLGENRITRVVRSQDEALTVDQLLLIGEITE